MFLIYLNAINIFTTDVNTCSTDKNIKIDKYKKVPKGLNKTQVTEKTFVKSQSESKFLCLKPKFYELSIKIIVF